MTHVKSEAKPEYYVIIYTWLKIHGSEDAIDKL